jgi:multidrug efflux system membrane fusion protein
MHTPEPSQDHAAPQAASSRVSRKALALGAVALAIAALVAWPNWRHGALESARAAAPPSAAQAPAVPVRTALVVKQNMPVAVTGVGNVLPIASVTVRSRVDGQLDRVEFKEGQDVKAGQVLARLDPRTFEATLQQAQATQARDQAQLANARTDLQRYTDLIKEDAATRQQVDTQTALVRQLAATVQSDAAQVNAARVQLGYTTIAAPIAGRIGARLVDPGNIVHATDANGLLVINQIDPIAVQFTLPESAFQSINKALHGGTPLTVQAIDRGSREVLATGQLTLLNNQIDATTGTVTMKAQFANAEHKLWPGQSIDARLVLGIQQNALTVPEAAVQRGQKGLFTFVVGADSTVRLQPIEVSNNEAGQAVVATGLAEGERVVTDGQYRLTPGTRVSEPAAAGDAGTAAGKPRS